MLDSRSFGSLDCPTQVALLDLCLTEADVEELGAGAEPTAARRSGLGRALLHCASHRDPEVATRIGDVLDARHCDWVLTVRGTDPELLAGWLPRVPLSRAAGGELEGLLWALCSDGREPVAKMGAVLLRRAVTRACRAFLEVEEPAVRRR